MYYQEGYGGSLRHSRENGVLPLDLRWPSASGSDSRHPSPFVLTRHPSTKIDSDKPVFQWASGSPDRASRDLCFEEVGSSHVYGPSVFGHTKVICDPQAGKVRTPGKGSRGICTQRTPPPCPSRSNAFEGRYPSALLPWTVLPANFVPVGGQGNKQWYQLTRRSSLGLQGEDVEKRRQEVSLLHRPLENECPRTLPVHLHHSLGLWYIMLVHLRNSGWNPAVSKTIAKNWWSTLSKSLDWSKLISAALVSSLNPSRTSRTRSSLRSVVLLRSDQVVDDKLQAVR